MYDRFTEQTRLTMRKADDVTKSFNHEYINTEHVLYGLCQVAEIHSFLQQLFSALNLNPAAIIKEIEAASKKGPEMITMGRMPQTPRVKKILEYAMEEARDLRRDYVGVEHLFLGMLREEESMATQILSKKVKYDAARAAIEDLYRNGTTYDRAASSALEALRLCAENAGIDLNFNRFGEFLYNDEQLRTQFEPVLMMAAAKMKRVG